MSFDLLNANVADLRDGLVAGSLTSEDIVSEYLSQIERHNIDGLGVRALVSTAPREIVLARARALDVERKEKGSRGPFHGIPILVKVCIHNSLDRLDYEVNHHDVHRTPS
jgi:amidase